MPSQNLCFYLYFTLDKNNKIFLDIISTKWKTEYVYSNSCTLKVSKKDNIEIVREEIILQEMIMVQLECDILTLREE